MSKTLCFVKPSLPYNPGDVVTFEDSKADEVLRHPMGIARVATQRDVDEAYARVGRKNPNAPAPAAASAPVSPQPPVQAEQPHAPRTEQVDEESEVASRGRRGRT